MLSCGKVSPVNVMPPEMGSAGSRDAVALLGADAETSIGTLRSASARRSWGLLSE